MSVADRGKTKLPGNQGQFGEGVATESYRQLRATQKVKVRPVVPRCPEGMSSIPEAGHRRDHPGSSHTR